MDGLRESAFRDSHLAAIVEHSTDAIVSKDLDGKVLSWNAAAERLFGWTAAEIVGQSIRRLIPEDRQHEEDEILDRIRSGELVSKFETLRVDKAGNLVPVAVTVSPIRDRSGKVVGASKIAHDLRDQAELRAELAASQQKFVALAQNIPQLAWMADANGWIYWYNQRWYDYTGTTLEQMQGWGWKDVHHPDHVDRVVERIQHSWDTGEDWEDTFPLRSADGQFRWFLSRARALKDEGGNILLWCGTNTDVTEQREANERIRMLMDEVNHRARNMLSTIQAIVRRTVGSADAELVNRLGARITALAANQDLLNQQDWAGAYLRDVVASQIAHLGELSNRIDLSGPDGLMVEPRAAEAIGLAVHELATNADKYGALSVSDGRVSVTWAIEKSQDEPRLLIDWRETGGPPVGEVTRSGFGTVIIKQNPEGALKASVDWRAEAEGMAWTLRAPASGVVRS